VTQILVAPSKTLGERSQEKVCLVRRRKRVSHAIYKGTPINTRRWDNAGYVPLPRHARDPPQGATEWSTLPFDRENSTSSGTVRHRRWYDYPVKKILRGWKVCTHGQRVGSAHGTETDKGGDVILHWRKPLVAHLN